MTPRKALVALSSALLLVLVIAPPAWGSPGSPAPSATLPVNLSFSPNPVNVNTPTTGNYAISGGTPPYTIWENNTPPGCGPQSNPMITSNPTGTFTCTPTATGNFPIHVDVQDSAGNSGSTQTSLSVTSGGSGGIGGNNTGGIDLSFLQNALPILLATGILFVGATVAIAASSVALAILVPRRLKQIRKALEAQTTPGHESPATPPPPKDQPPSGEA